MLIPKVFHENNTNVLIFPFLSNADQENLGMADKVWRKAKKKFELQGYQILNNRIAGKEAIYIKNGNGFHQKMLLRVLGQGGCKKAIELDGGKALIVPNMNADGMLFIVDRWKRIVYEEVTMSQLLTLIGLLSPLSHRINISFSEDSNEGTIPAYVSESFENLGKTRAWFIIDKKNPESSTWKEGENYLFATKEQRLNKLNWDSVVNPFLSDIAKICMYDIPIGLDSFNYAIVRNASESTISQYQIRYFGFDFSSKRSHLSIPNIQEKKSSCHFSKISGLLNDMLDFVFFREFGKAYDYGDDREKLHNLKDQLVIKYRKEALLIIREGFSSCLNI